MVREEKGEERGKPASITARHNATHRVDNSYEKVRYNSKWL